MSDTWLQHCCNEVCSPSAVHPSMSRLAPVAEPFWSRGWFDMLPLLPPPLGGGTGHATLWLPLSVSHSGNTLFLAVGILEIPITSAVVFPLLPHQGYSKFGCRLRQSFCHTGGSNFVSTDLPVSCALEPAKGSCWALEQNLSTLLAKWGRCPGSPAAWTRLLTGLLIRKRVCWGTRYTERIAEFVAPVSPLFIMLHGHTSCITGCFLLVSFGRWWFAVWFVCCWGLLSRGWNATCTATPS